MDRTTLSDPAVIGRLDKFVKVKVDGDARPDLVSSFGVEAYPTFLHLDANGRVIEKREGFMRVQELAGSLDRTWQSVSTSLAIAQANSRQNPSQQAEQQQQQQGSGPQQGTAPQRQQSPQVASADLNLMPMEEGKPSQRETRNVTRETNDGGAPATAMYDRTDPKLQGSVYAMGAGPTSERRSRFGGSSASNPGLRELAEATAQPGSVEDSQQQGGGSDESAEAPTTDLAKATDVDTTEKSKEEETKATAAKAKEVADAKAKQDADTKAKADADAKTKMDADAKVEVDRKAVEKPVTEVAKAAPSPVIETRLAALSEAELPKPLLSRSASATTQQIKPATIVSTSSQKDPLATIRRIQGDDGAPRPAISARPQAIVAEAKAEAVKEEVAKKAPAVTAKAEEAMAAETRAAEPKAETKAAEAKVADAKAEELKKEPAREVASVPVKAESASEKKTTTMAKAGSSKSSSKSDEEKTAEGASRSDIERWMKDADTKLVSSRKKEARAMYSKVVENDPKNQFGKSDMAYVKMVSLIVDRDSDLLRREAYSKIKEFEARFPESDHKDYYTLIRAILAADLGETNEAHKLLGSFADRFPDSKYRELAHDAWKDLPPVKKETKKATAAKQGSSKSKQSDS